MEALLLNIIVDLVIIGYPICIFKLLNKRDKRKLIKHNKFQNYKVIESPSAIRKTRSNKESNIKNNKEIEQLVNSFLNRLKLYITDDEIKHVENNLKTLQYKKSNILFLKLTQSSGYYAAKKHSISVNKNQEEDSFIHTIYHELLHAVTSSYNNHIYYCGFSQTNQKKNKQIGKLLNEGYTELLINRMFSSSDDVGYPYGKAVAALVEFIIGTDKMQKLFFNIDLEGLIKELSKYNDTNQVKQFILNLDTINTLENSKDQYEIEILAKLYNEVSIFLYETFQNKMEQTINAKNLAGYEFLSNQFLNLFNQIHISTQFAEEDKKRILDDIEKEELIAYKEYIKAKKEFNKTKNKQGKTLIKDKNNNKGFINIIAITSILTIISLLSIGISYLLLNAR